MSKDKIADYDGTTAGNNTDIGGISIAEGMLPSAVNNSMRELTKQLGAFANGTDAIDALTSDGNILVGTTDTVPSNNGASGDAGVAISPDGVFRAARSGNVSLDINRMDSDGEIAAFRKDGTTVGSIGTASGDLTIYGDVGIRFSGDDVRPLNSSGAQADNSVDLGHHDVRWQDLYLGGNLYLGGTGSANAISDVEVGTWTPTFLASGTNPTINSVGNNTGYYVKVGDIVHFSYYTAAMNIGSAGSGGAQVGNLPFNSSNGTNEYWLFQYVHGTAIGSSVTGGYIINGQNYMQFILPNSTGGVSWTAGNPQYMMIAGSYRVA